MGVRGGFGAFLTRKDRRHIGKWGRSPSEPKKWLFWGPNFRYDRRYMGAILGRTDGFEPFLTPNDRRHIGKPQINSDYVHRFAYYLVKIINFPNFSIKIRVFFNFLDFFKKRLKKGEMVFRVFSCFFVIFYDFFIIFYIIFYNLF